MHFCIVLGDGTRMSPKGYLRVIKLAKENPKARFDRSLNNWWSASGEEITQQWKQMLTEKWANWNSVTGKGRRAAKRAREIKDRAAECRWCGQKTGSSRNKFCCVGCAQAYSS